MNLIQKLSTASLLSTSLAGASGCGHVAGALITGVVNEQQGKANRAAMLEAAQIQSNQQENITNYHIYKNDRFFTYKTFLGDSNNNEIWDRNEFDGYELDSYPPLEVKLFAQIYNKKGAEITIKKEEIGSNKSSIFTIPKRLESNRTIIIITPNENWTLPGKSYIYTYNIGNTRLGKITYTISEEK
jgi:hypothetical protein